MKKIIAINGSPRRNGNTAELLQHALRGASDAGAETELVHLYSLKFTGCLSCFYCKRKDVAHGVCAVKDDLAPVFFMSIHGQTKGTPLEPISEMMAKAEANGTMMYYALARLAKEQGLEDVSKTFIEAANQEAVHAGFYATLNAKVPQDFWMLVRGVMAAEYRGDTTVKEMADKYRAAGLTEAADEMEIFAKQEGHHGEMLEALLKKYKPETLDVAGKKIYVCGCCGYEYIGDLDAEPEDFVCPVCGMQKKVFKLKA